MIHVSCGHERGIGLEVFLKSFLLLGKAARKSFLLHVTPQALEEYGRGAGLKLAKDADGVTFSTARIACRFMPTSTAPLSTVSLESCLASVSPDDVLVTMPTSKDQLVLDGQVVGGHTEYLRKRYGLDEIAMCFKSPSHFVALASDHWPLRDVPARLDRRWIEARASAAILGHREYVGDVREVVFAGINPHAGEGGLLGHEDEEIRQAIAALALQFPDIKMTGPVSGDAMYSYHRRGSGQIQFFMYHDQGLSYFKALNRSLGANMSMGLPYLRLSVDHGTAFELYGKNLADYGGCLYVLKTALEAHHRQNP